MGRRTRTRSLAGVGVSILVHLVILLALFSQQTPTRTDWSQVPAVEVILFAPPPPAPPPPKPEPKPEPKAEPQETKPLAAKSPPPRPLPPRHMTPTPRAAPTPVPSPSREPPAAQAGTGTGVELSAAQIAGAASADSGPAGGVCDMPRLLQRALRKDPLVQAAVARSGGKALMVWNGDWVQGEGEDGKGLAAVREAILWEVGFAPKACRSEPVHGLVLLSMKDAPGATRLALGGGNWRWSDLLSSR
jgi:hypothetical protein